MQAYELQPLDLRPLFESRPRVARALSVFVGAVLTAALAAPVVAMYMAIVTQA
ncbi:MAG: hypothetical protein AB7L65_07050 [Hyphomonadaceae bacterium]